MENRTDVNAQDNEQSAIDFEKEEIEFDKKKSGWFNKNLSMEKKKSRTALQSAIEFCKEEIRWLQRIEGIWLYCTDYCIKKWL